MTLMLRGIVLAWGVMMAGPATAATVPVGFSESLVAGGLRSPTAMAFAPDGRLFICEQGGRLRVVSNGVLQSRPFVTLTVNSSGERGLLGVAFDPAFETNRFVYVYYTATTPTIHNRVSRFTADGDEAVPGSEEVLFDLEPLGATNHNGGAIHFGRDGKLYIAVGDNANGSNAQSLSTRLGKILRINSDGTIPSDNPFDAITNGDNKAIWALGLRNPFTFAIEPGTGRMFINDVGELTWEEIDEGVAGANYGWPTTEGPTNDPRFKGPLHAYGHSDGCAIAGGAFYNPANHRFPFAYHGSYFFADLCGGWIRRLVPETGNVTDFVNGIPAPVDLQVGADGSLYYLARGSGSTSGVVYRVEYVGPHINITANGQDGLVVLDPGDPLAIAVSFTTGIASNVDPGEAYFGAASAFGTLWWDPVTRRFVPTPTPVHSGSVADFGPATLVNLPDSSVLRLRVYWWFAIVDNDSNGVPNGTYLDAVLTIVP
jgi:glucose/arabinose dehydrogenase